MFCTKEDAADWNAIRTEYITTHTSYRKLSLKYGISESRITKVGIDEGWVAKREKYEQETVDKGVKRAQARDVRRLKRLSDATLAMVDVVTAAIEDEKQFKRYLVNRNEKYNVPLDVNGDGVTLVEERSWTEEQVFRKVDARAIRDLTQSLKQLTDMLRDYYGVQTPAQEEMQRIARERLELDKQRLAASIGTDDDGDTGIVLIPERADAGEAAEAESGGETGE